MVICGDMALGVTGWTETIQDFSSLSRMVALGREMTSVIAMTLANINIPNGIKIRVSIGLRSIDISQLLSSHYCFHQLSGNYCRFVVLRVKRTELY